MCAMKNERELQNEERKWEKYDKRCVAKLMGFCFRGEIFFVNVTLGLLKSCTADTRNHKYTVAKNYSQI